MTVNTGLVTDPEKLAKLGQHLLDRDLWVGF